MSIGDAIVLVSCLGGTMFALPALLTFLNMAFSRTTERAVERLEYSAIVPFFVGLIPVIFIGAPAAFLLSIGSVAQFCGSVAYLALFLWAFTGMGVISRLVGKRISDFSGRTPDPFLESLIGAFVLAFAIAFPLVGWFIILPFSLIIGMGATLMAVVGRFMGKPLFEQPARKEMPRYDSDSAYQGA